MHRNAAWLSLAILALVPCFAVEGKVTVSSPSPNTIEETGTGNTAKFEVVLTTQPTGNIVVNMGITTTDAAAPILSTASLTFTNGNFDTVQTVTVTAVDDDNVDGNKGWEVAYTVVPATGVTYDTTVQGTTSGLIQDDDSAGLIVAQVAGQGDTSEGGATSRFTVKLTAKPEATITVTATVEDSTVGFTRKEATVDAAKEFLPNEWNTPKTFQLTGSNDDVNDGDTTYEVSFAMTDTTNTDTNFPSASATPPPYVLKNTDDDDVGVLVGAISAQPAEAGTPTQTYTIALQSNPTGPVTVALTNQKASEGTIVTPNPAQFVFNPVTGGNGVGIPASQTVTVKAVDDSVDDDGNTWSITHTVTSATDGTGDNTGYNGAVAPSITITNVNDDNHGVVVTYGSATMPRVVTEPGTGDQQDYIMKLSSEPVGQVTITMVPAAGLESQVSLSANALTFSPDGANGIGIWSTVQTIVIKAADDSIDESAVDVLIDQTISSTPVMLGGQQYNTDPLYNALSPASIDDITVQVVDDADTAGVTTDPVANGMNAVRTVNELMTTTATIGLKLNSQPIAPVTFNVKAYDTTEATITPTSLTFEATGAKQWDQLQSITVTAFNDDVADGNQVYPVGFEVDAATADAKYTAVTVTDVYVETVDDDTVGFDITMPTATALTEDTSGTPTATYTIKLESEPTKPVTIAPTASNTEGAVILAIGTSLFFDSANWNVYQTVTVSAQDDDVDDDSAGTPTFDVTHTVTSADAGYNGAAVTTYTFQAADNDASGVIVTPASTQPISISETSGTSTYTVQLQSMPSDRVEIGVSSSNNGQCTVDPASIVISKTQWNNPVTVTVTGVPNNIADGSVTCTAVNGAVTSGDALYSGTDPDDVTFTVTDDDTAGVLVGALMGQPTEGGLAATFTVKLNSQPTTPVTVDLALSASGATEATLSPGQIVIAPGDYATGETITLTGKNDDVDDDTTTYSVVTTVTATDMGGTAEGSVPTSYNGIAASDVTGITTLDDDTFGITFGTISGPTGEDMSTATFTVKLNTQPANSAMVVLKAISDNTNEGDFDANADVLTFDSGNYNTELTLTVTGQNDAIDDGNIQYNINFEVTSADTLYDNETPAPIAVTNNDDGDTAGVTLGTASNDVLEDMTTTGTFTAVLNSMPVDTVTVTMTGMMEVSLDVAALEFDAINWNVPQLFTFTAVDDDVDDGDKLEVLTPVTSSATDLKYGGNKTWAGVAVRAIDDDVASVAVVYVAGANPLVTNENQTEGEFSVALTSEPTVEPLTVTLTVGDADEGMISTSVLSFTKMTWNVAQTVVVTGKDEFIVDGPKTYTITGVLSGAGMSEYNGVTVPSVNVRNDDDDVADITITAISGPTGEDRSTANFTVVLTSQPTAEVVLSFASDTAAEGTLPVTSLTFSTGTTDWSTVRTVVVQGVDDFIDDDDQNYQITFMNAVSTDMNYNGKAVGPLAVVNTDDDTAGVRVEVTDAMTSEASTADKGRVTVKLESQPTADVVIGISVSDANEGTTATTSLTFVTGVTSWQTAQVIEITGVNDDVDDDDVLYSIVTAPATSTDMKYAGFNPLDATLTNVDDDEAGFTVSTISGTTIETSTGAPSQATFDIVLTSKPLADVVIGLTSSNGVEGTVVPTVMTFTDGDWNVPKVATVTSGDDDFADGPQTFTIVTSAAQAVGDMKYNNIDPADVNVTNNDNDAVGIVVSAPDLVTTEAGGTAVFTLVAQSRPYNNVEVSVSGNNPTEALLSTTMVTFTADANWNQVKSVTVTGQNEFIDDDDQPHTVTIGNGVSADAAYEGLAPTMTTIAMTNTDDDDAGISVTPPTMPYMTSEDGSTASLFQVKLTSEPLGDVAVVVTTNDTSEGAVLPVSFTPADWNIIKTVSVTGQDDFFDDGDQMFTVSFDGSSSTDLKYQITATQATYTLTNVDDETHGITVTPPASLNTTEMMSMQTFTVVLDSQPTAQVVINIASSDATEGVTSTSALTFATGVTNWKVAQTVTVTGQNDDLDDDDQPYSVSVTATSADMQYATVAIAGVPFAFTNADDDVSSVVVTPTMFNTSEALQNSKQVSVMLTAEPTDDVTISLAPTDSTEAIFSTTSMIFTGANWDTAQIAVVTGTNDAVDDDDVEYTVVTTIASMDAKYNVLAVDDIVITNIDDDTAGIMVMAISNETAEAGMNATYKVKLTSEPTAAVGITFTSNDTTEGDHSQSITFSAADWNVYQTVQVVGRNDNIDDDNIVYLVSASPAVSADAKYNGLVATPLTLSNRDNDTAGVLVSSVSGNTNEMGQTATWTARLQSEPVSDVTITAMVADATELQIVQGVAVFNATNWMMPQTFIVKGLDDMIDDDSVASIVMHTISTTDMKYSMLMISNFSVINEDDSDTAGFNITNTTGSMMTSEAGAMLTYSVRLTSQPVDVVTLNVVSSDESEGKTNPTMMVFDMTNWNVEQTLTVMGQDDAVDDDDVMYTIDVLPAVSTDGKYTNLDAGEFALTNMDDDTAGYILAATTLVVDEAGTTDMFTMRLTSEPLTNVTFTFSNFDASEYTLSVPAVTFTPSMWSTEVTVVVSGIDDAIDDDVVMSNITIGPAVSTDAKYSGTTVPDVVVMSNDDLDQAGFSVDKLSLATTEDGAQDTYAVALLSQPVVDVTLSVVVGDAAEIMASAFELVFTPGNWDVFQTVVVTGVDDLRDDGDQMVVIMHGPAVAASGKYDGMMVGNVTVTNFDNGDISAVLYTAPTTGVAESGATAELVVMLATEPFADVTVNFTSTDVTEGVVSPSMAVFSPTNWFMAQTIMIMPRDDFVADGPVSFDIVALPAVSADAKYSGLGANSIAITNADDDEASLNFDTSGNEVNEAGQVQTATFVLTAQPLADVTIPVSVSDPTEAMLDVDAIVFTPDTWNLTMTVTITGVDDSIDDDAASFMFTVGSTMSADPLYNGREGLSVMFTNADDLDTAGVVTSQLSGAVGEDGSTATFTVRLTSQPLGTVIVPVTSSNPGEVLPTVDALQFTANDWDTTQTVTMRGVDDNFADGPQDVQVSVGPLTSSDAKYNGLSRPGVVVRNNDDADAVGISVTTSSLNTSEAGGNAMVMIALQSQPLSAVTVAVSSSDTTEATVSVSQLVFLPAQWNVVQTITVAGVNDDVDDDDVAYTFVTANLVSDDMRFNGFSPPDVIMVNIDDDAAGVSISEASGPVTERGGSATFTVLLTSQPTGSVEVTFSVLDSTEATLSGATLTFGPMTWNVPQTTVVRGVDDSVNDGDQSVGTRYRTQSSDRKYQGLSGSGPLLVNIDDDLGVPGVTPQPPVVVVPTAAPGGTPGSLDNRIRWCVRDSQCFGTGSFCNTAVSRCQCGAGFESPVVQGIKEYNCVPVGTSPGVRTFDAAFSLVWTQGSCAQLRANNGRLLTRLLNLLRAYLGQLESWTLTCASVHLSSSGQFTSLEAYNRLENSLATVKQQTDSDPELQAALGASLSTEALVLPTTETACPVANAAETVPFNVNGRTVCSALRCNTGFVKTTGFNGEQICTPVLNPSDPTSVQIPCELTTDCTGYVGQTCSSATKTCTSFGTPVPRGGLTMAPADDDDDTERLLTIILPIVFGLLCCSFIIALCIVLNKDKDKEEDAAREQESPHKENPISSAYPSAMYPNEGSTVFEQSEADAEFAKDILV